MKQLFKKQYLLLMFTASLIISGCSEVPEKVVQTAISRVEGMPNLPEPYKQLKWQEKAINFDQYVFDPNQLGEFMPLIWMDSSKRNIDQETFGLFTVIGDVRQGFKAHPDFHESLTSLGALMSAGLSGIDKTNQNGFNYVKMSQNYFNSDTGWNIVMNNTNPDIAMLGGGYGRDWWYDVYPNLLFYAVSDLYPNVENAEQIQRTVAEQFYKADSILSGNYEYSYFDYAMMKGMNNHIPPQEDAAAGHAYVLLSAYNKFGDEKYLAGAKSAIAALENLKESRFYEVLLPFGAYVASRLNAEHGTDYDVLKILNWSFDGCKAERGRTGWGVISEKWGPYDVHGLQGSITDGGGYAFLMNTHSMAWPLVPMVKYDPSFARAIGKWMLNASNAARLFYPYEIDNEHQWLPEKKVITKNVIAYEGLRKTDAYGKESLKGVEPVALGDGPNWLPGQPDESMFSLYSSAYAGIYGAIIKQTNQEKILQLNCNATDFYGADSFPTYLYYNPFAEAKRITFENREANPVDLYNVLTHTVVASGVSGIGSFEIPADEAALMVVIPHEAKVQQRGDKFFVQDKIVAYK
ncbi:MAG: hypothetical protein ABJN36_03015 [Cyclobacteriaceae bacterium]